MKHQNVRPNRTSKQVLVCVNALRHAHIQQDRTIESDRTPSLQSQACSSSAGAWHPWRQPGRTNRGKAAGWQTNSNKHKEGPAPSKQQEVVVSVLVTDLEAAQAAEKVLKYLTPTYN